MKKIKNLFFLLAILNPLLASCNIDETMKNSVDNSATLEKENMTLVFNDDFEGNELNEEHWNYMLGDGTAYGNPGWGNQEDQYYQKENARVEDSMLIITAKKESAGGKEYTSARLSTAGKVKAKYGRIEARISLPEVQGMWPAFWMLPESDNPYGSWPCSGEIDIMEARGRVNNCTSAALHFGTKEAARYETRVYQMRDNTTINDFHVYALEWEELEMRWYVDDNLFFRLSNAGDRPQWITGSALDSRTAPFDWDFHILLNMAVGGHFDNFTLPPEDFTSCEMKVDYVRIYSFI